MLQELLAQIQTAENPRRFLDGSEIKPIRGVQTPTVPPLDLFLPELGLLCDRILDFAINNRETTLAGLAANQVAINGQRVELNACFVNIAPTGWVVALNPHIISKSGFPLNSREGCLTWPGKVVEALRWDQVTVQYQNIRGETQIREAKDFEAKVWQHEINHLNGIPEYLRDEKPPVGRNDPCPCGSGKKYKKCCGR